MGCFQALPEHPIVDASRIGGRDILEVHSGTRPATPAYDLILASPATTMRAFLSLSFSRIGDIFQIERKVSIPDISPGERKKNAGLDVTRRLDTEVQTSSPASSYEIRKDLCFPLETFS